MARLACCQTTRPRAGARRVSLAQAPRCYAITRRDGSNGGASNDDASNGGASNGDAGSGGASSGDANSDDAARLAL